MQGPASKVSSKSAMLLSLLAYCFLMSLLVCPGTVEAAAVAQIEPVGCSNYHSDDGNHNTIASKLDGVCKSCYDLMHEPDIYKGCKAECFTTFSFKGCVESLQKDAEMESFQKMIATLNGS